MTSGSPAQADDVQPAPAPTVTLDRVLRALPDMSPADRQRLYEDLHGIYDCRIYRR